MKANRIVRMQRYFFMLISCIMWLSFRLWQIRKRYFQLP